jgi:hypothetical protein
LKKYIKYGLIIIGAMAIVGLLFYILKKPNNFVLKNIPADVTYCFTINKKDALSEKSLSETFEKDTFFKNIKGRIAPEVFEIIRKIGFNPFGDMAIFGQNNHEINFAWVGNNKTELQTLIKQKKWVETKKSHYNLVKISNQLYLKYNWPIIELSNNNTFNDFFNPKTKKLTKADIEHTKTKGNLIYGFIISDREFIIHYPFIPLYGKAYIGVQRLNNKINISFTQSRVVLKGKLGKPKLLPQSNALISWPLDSGHMPVIKQIPNIVSTHLNQLINRPVKHIYAELLDTISTYQEIIQYDMNDEFQLTQKVINHFTTFPGMRLQFIKTHADQHLSNHQTSKSTNLGLDIFKLKYTNTSNSFIISSEDVLPLPYTLNLPDYYLYANFDLLKSDPYWRFLSKSDIRSLQLHAENYEKGTVFILQISLKN